ncbi:MAG: hypothetical protein GWN84_26015, partial [Gammaproteobacteria bacterium]|nr:hypothetical protein [Gammaproteobacteria bacterium]NIU07239.1 hypothetical protein [Gammaproteobacteria bacterium]NIV54043.1 hypothetical protein [Gammaproteobacteria bacterium]NIX88512.1 hypothetical protein [Gammaproteobacteria bacterium]
LFPAEVAATDGLWFGGVSILKDRVRADLRFRLDEGKWRRFTLKARFVGCSDEGHCYPAREIVVPVDRTETQQ